MICVLSRGLRVRLGSNLLSACLSLPTARRSTYSSFLLLYKVGAMFLDLEMKTGWERVRHAGRCHRIGEGCGRDSVGGTSEFPEFGHES